MQPVVLVLTLLVFLFGLMLLEIGERTVRRQQGRAAAESAALYALRSMHGDDYAVPGAAAKPQAMFQWDQLVTMARANGMDPKAFLPLVPDDVQVGPTWVEVTVRPRNPKHRPVAAAAVGVPAGKIRQGKAWYDGAGNIERVSGCLPLGIQLASIPVPPLEGSFRLELGEDHSPAAFVKLPGSEHETSEHIAFLGYEPLQPAQGAAPPAVEVGASVSFEPADPDLVAEAAARLKGRIVMVPLLHGLEIVGFGRLYVEEIDVEPPAVRVRLAPSAVGRLAAAGGYANRFPSAPDAVSPLGIVLRPRRGG